MTGLQDETGIEATESLRPRRTEEESEPAPQPGESESEAQDQGEYGLHIRLAKEMQETLDNATQLAFEMGDIQKSTLGELINLYIGWGLAIQKKKALDRLGYQ